MINLADLIFCIGLATAVFGSWQLGVANGLIASGIATCLASVVLRKALAVRGGNHNRRQRK